MVHSGIQHAGFSGCKLWAPRVLVVATHDDVKPTGAAYKWDSDAIVLELQKAYESDLILEPHIFTVDANQPMCPDMSTLKQVLSVIKKFVCDVRDTEIQLIFSSGLDDSIV